MAKKIIYPEDIHIIHWEQYKDYTMGEMQAHIAASFAEVENRFGEFYRDITVSLENDYSSCYYDGDSPSMVLQFKGVRREAEKK